uniref:inosine/xanthosine triphosphatase n=1 Tax=Sexangularia sp. CB-2014 TaxID=1486929 RepID=A0A7S1VFI6_9EUKA
MLFLVGTTNPSKLSAVSTAVCAVFNVPDGAFQVKGVAVPSGVGDQPWGAAETRLGARNRAIGALANGGGAADLPQGFRVFGVGIEGGIEEVDGEFFSSEWVCVAELGGTMTSETATALQAGMVDGLVQMCFGSSGRVPLDRLSVIEPLQAEATELGVVMQRLSAQSEQVISRTVGAMGLLTNGAIPRGVATHQGICFAFGPFVTDRTVYWKSYESP